MRQRAFRLSLCLLCVLCRPASGAQRQTVEGQVLAYDWGAVLLFTTAVHLPQGQVVVFRTDSAPREVIRINLLRYHFETFPEALFKAGGRKWRVRLTPEKLDACTFPLTIPFESLDGRTSESRSRLAWTGTEDPVLLSRLEALPCFSATPADISQP